MSRHAVRATEYLKAYISEIIERYHEGGLNGAQAQAMLWDEVTRVVASIKPKHFDDVLWLRVEVPEGDRELQRVVIELVAQLGKVLSVRYAGSREKGESGVLYMAVLTTGILKAQEIVYTLTKEGYSIRDWTYGCHRR